MDKYEYRVRADEIKDLIARGDYSQAAEIADTIDWRRVKSVMMLCTISDLYKINRRYEDAKNMLLLAYERRPGGKTICYSLCELCIKTEEFIQAVNYYKEFVQVAPKDPGRYILQYKLYEAQDVGLEERIGVLEELKKRDYREKWAYELAYLYHRVGLATRCVEECDELILWFGDGKYVIKAMELKMLHQPLSASQQAKYDHRFDSPEPFAAVQRQGAGNPRGGQEGRVRAGQPARGAGQLQPAWEGQAFGAEEQSAWNGRTFGSEEQPAWEGQTFGSEEQPAWEGQTFGSEEQSAWNGQAFEAEGQPAWDGRTSGAEVSSDTRTDWVLSGRRPPEQETIPVAEHTEELDIQVKTMDMGAYNTLNLQAEIAAGLQEVLAEDRTKSDAITRSILAPLLDSDTESLDMPEIDEVDESDLEPAREVIEGTEVFFGETGELGNAQKEEKPAPRWMEEIHLDVVPPAEFSNGKQAEVRTEEVPAEEKAATENALTETAEIEKLLIEKIQAEMTQTEGAGGPESKRESGTGGEKGEVSADETAVIVMNQLRMESMGRSEEQVLTAQPPKEIAGVLSQESDGQISLVMPEGEKIEKQITGQMSIEDVLDEWEKLKKESEARRQEEVRQHVLEQTGNMLTKFEESVKDGLLEQLESEPEQEAEEVELAELAERSGETESEEAEEAGQAEDESAQETGQTEPAEQDERSADADMEETEESAGESQTEEETESVEAEEAGQAENESAQETGQAEPAERSGSEADADMEETEKSAEESQAERSGETKSEEAEEVGQAEDEPAQEADADMEETGDSAEEPQAESEKSKTRALTREEKELYAPFIQSRSGRERLVRAIDSISMAACTGNIIITGEEGMDTLSLAKNMVREIQMTDSNFSGKVAKVSGQGLNSKNVEETLEHLKNGALIVQKASEMKGGTVGSLQKMLQKDNFGIIVILEDTKRAMEKLLKAHPELRESFTARMDVEAMSNDSLVAFGRQYAREREYSIDELGVLALHTRIEERQTIDHVVSVIEVKDIVDESIRHANRKTLGHFFDILLARRYDEEDMIILTEKDFV